ncbi:MAG: phosphonate ABC transporter ATP-binding protein [Planctomycetota bacterium]|nr:MAG: phosphonate ABC transporter ATP-binding protein [Planctomycetota bacterium]
MNTPHSSPTDLPAVEVLSLSKTFSTAFRKHRALHEVDLRIESGSMVGLIGASGSGKSTLLRHITGLVRSDSGGEIRVFGQTVQNNGRLDPHIRRLRREVGFIFQQFNLVDRLTLLTNVLVGRLAHMPFHRRMLGWFTGAEIQQAMAALDRVGIGIHAGQRAGTLSGGQQQRAAIARAMMQEAKLILADEPIASLDPESSRRVMEALSDVNRIDGTTVVVCLHQVEFAKRYCQRIVALKAGRIVFDGVPDALTHDLLTDLYGSEADDAGIAQQRPRPSHIPHTAPIPAMPRVG